jgi:gas vesicle protein
MANNDSDFGAFLSGFVIGGLVGAAVSLMMAPQSGEETREQIRTKGIELRGRAEDEIADLRVRAEQTLADVRAQADDVQQKTMKMVDEARSKVNDALEEGKEAAKRVRKDATGSSTGTESAS